ncbi:restriction endonuclease subunit S, partial [Lactobacillus helveticus]|nr:restriction endonuclease subunit S [Lactobacillus helveticus]
MTKADLLDKETFVPIKVEEQQKIGSFFKQLDDTIALQQRKLRLLKLLKKATQQNIFASTECLPKLKYRDLTGKWQLY